MHFLRIAILPALAAAAVGAQTPVPKPKPDTAARLEGIKVVAPRTEQAPPSPMQILTLPVSASVTAQRVEQTVNLVDAEDAVKYLPSVFLRKRNNGDTQATMATRVWGVSSSARSLIFADGVPLSALIANNNNIGGPRWGLVSPIEIARIDMMYGPYSAAYAGNSMGAVMEITTRLPQRLEGAMSQTQAVQRFDLYGTRRSFGTSQTNADVGDRFGRFSVWAGGSYQKSSSQPLAYVTAGAFPTGTTGGYTEKNKLGAPANVLGATGLLHTGMANAKIKAAYEIAPGVRATYTFGYWKNDANADASSYIDRSGQPTFAGQAAFATGFYTLLEQHTAQSLSVRTDLERDWDFEVVGALYDFNTDQQRTPITASANDGTFGSAGRIASLDGTGWSSLDAKVAWHRGGPRAANVLTFGAHHDRYELVNPTYNSADWRAGPSTTVATEGDGRTRTDALWAQDGWRMTPALKLTVGARLERWRAFDGYNASGTTSVVQPAVAATRVSPKAVLAWGGTSLWSVATSIGKAYRFATAAELYQLVTTGTTFTSPNPDLKPDNVLSAELRVGRLFDRGSAQLSLFQDDVHDAIISQFLPLVAGSPTLYSYASNVDHVRARGAEVSLGGTDVVVHGLELTASATYLDARTLALSGRASATAPAGSAVGKFLPNIPKWRGTVAGTYHVDKLAVTVAGRYNSRLFTTLDNADVNSNTYQGFSEWFVADAHVNYAFDRHWSASVGADNVLNRKYFLFHPFPQRTFVGTVKYGF
jgi:iron complex outermembrane receptor protein